MQSYKIVVPSAKNLLEIFYNSEGICHLAILHMHADQTGECFTEKKFWVTTAHHDLPQKMFYVNIVTVNAALVTAAKSCLLQFNLL